MIDETGGFREGFDGSQDYDLFLRASTVAGSIEHIPQILYHWRAHENSTAQSGEAKHYAIDSSKKAIFDYPNNNAKYKAKVSDGLDYGTFNVSYEVEGSPEVSIIIPTKDKVEVLKRCVSSILNETEYSNYKILIVDNSSV